MSHNESHDVVVVGAGPAGAIVAHELGKAGYSVLLLDSGGPAPVDRESFVNSFYESPSKLPESPYPPYPGSDGNYHPSNKAAPRPTTAELGASPEHSYLIQKGPLDFLSTYERLVGGTTWHWLGTSLRLLRNDVSMKSTYGVEVDWPIAYDELTPYYADAEHAFPVSCDADTQHYMYRFNSLPKDYSYPLPGISQSYGDKQVAQAVEGMHMFGQPVSVAPTPQARNSVPHDNRRSCAGNTSCIPICPISAKYDASMTVAAAEQTGNVTVKPRHVASRVRVNTETGRVEGIEYKTWDSESGGASGHGVATGTLYVLAAHAIETPRLLQLSRTENLPHGVANSSGQVGRNLMDHPVYLAWALTKDPVYGFRGPLSTSGIESLRDGAFRKDRAAFRMEIGNTGWNFPTGAPYNTVEEKLSAGLWGRDLVDALAHELPRQLRIGCLVEQTPESGNRVTLSDHYTDGLGLARPEIHYGLSDYTKRGIAAAQHACAQVFQAMGAHEKTQYDENKPHVSLPDDAGDGNGGPVNVSGAGHIMGTLRMGDDPKTSVVDSSLKSHDHDNLYMLGSATFPTVGTANPTLTIAALSFRAADTLKSRLKKG